MNRLIQNPWVVCLSASLFFFYEYFQINMFNALDVELMKAFHVDGATLSWLSSAYFYGVIILLLPAGIILDKTSPRKLILITMVVSILGTIMFTMSQTWEQAALGRFIVGLSAGPFALLSVLKLASRWFKANQMAFATGVIIAIGMIAGIMAQAPFTYLVTTIGWREALWINIGAGVIMYIVMHFLINDYPKEKMLAIIEEKRQAALQGFLSNLKQVFTTKENWQCGLFAALTNLPIFMLGALWGGLYLTQAHGFTRMDAAYITTMLYVGMLIGSPVFGWFSDKIKLRKLPMIFGAGLCTLSIIAVMQSNESSFISFLLLFFVMGFGSSAQILAYPTVAETNPPALMASAEGLAATLIMGAGALFQPILGWLIKYNWDGTMHNGVPFYSPADYYYGISIIPISILFSIVVICFMKETNCESVTMKLDEKTYTI